MFAPLYSITDASILNTFLEQHNAHVLQTYAWGELKSQFGWRAERVAWRDEGTICAAAQILYRPLAPGLSLAYIPRGPIASNLNTLAQFLAQLKQHVRARGVFMLKLEPDWHPGDERDTALLQTQFGRSAETIQPPATIHIDLTAPLETILGRMKSKWRYNIRLSEKKGVTVRAGTVADFEAFYQLMRLTGERDHFAIHGANYYRKAFELLHAYDNVRLFVAEFSDNGTAKTLGMIFVTAFAQEAIYLYGASGNEERNRMPNHALHWAAIQWAKARGCTRYDLWGIPETIAAADDDANLPSSLYQFKQGFGGEIVRYTGAWDFVFNQPLYQLYRLARRIRKSSLG
jgi:peptidoglycan pentaglycine glycine transferase (the first glycine)